MSTQWQSLSTGQGPTVLWILTTKHREGKKKPREWNNDNS